MDKVKEVLGRISEIMSVSILFTVCCLPVFTIGAAHCGLYYAVYKSVRNNRGYVTQVFLQGFRDNFKKATGGWLLCLLGFAVFGIDFYLISLWEVSGKRIAFMALFIILAFVLWCISLYLFSYLNRFEDKLKRSFKNVVRLAFAGFARTVFLGILSLLCVVCCALFPPGVLFLPGLYAMVETHFLEKTFRRIMSEEDRILEDKRNFVEY